MPLEKGTRVKKIKSEPKDGHQDGAMGTVVGVVDAKVMMAPNETHGPMPVRYGYFVEWDDLRGLPVFTVETRLEVVDGRA